MAVQLLNRSSAPESIDFKFGNNDPHSIEVVALLTAMLASSPVAAIRRRNRMAFGYRSASERPSELRALAAPILPAAGLSGFGLAKARI